MGTALPPPPPVPGAEAPTPDFTSQFDLLPPLPAFGDREVNEIVQAVTDEALANAGLSASRENDERSERHLLWRLITLPSEQALVTELVRDEWFSHPLRATITGYLREMVAKQDMVTPDSLVEFAQERARRSIHRPALLKELDAILGASTGRSFDELSQVLARTFRARSISQLIFREASTRYEQGEDIDKLIASLENILVELGRSSKRRQKFSDIMRKVHHQVLHPDKSRAGKQLGLRDFDRQFGGLKKDRVITVGGYTGSGKTAFLVDLLYRLLYYHRNEIAIKVFSFEMSEERLGQRLFSRAAGVSVKRQDDWWVKVRYDRDKDGNEVEVPLMDPLNEDEIRRLNQALPFFETLDEVIDMEYASYSLEEMERECRQFALQHKGKHLIFMADHLGLVKKSGNDNRTEFDNIMNGVKDIARRYDATFLMLVQLAKSVESRFNKAEYYRPTSSDIMESVGVEAASDIVILLWRPHKYFQSLPYIHPDLNIYSNETDEDDWWDCRYRMVALIVKNRDGSAFNDIVFDADMAHSKLYNYDQLRKVSPELFTRATTLFSTADFPDGTALGLAPPPLAPGREVREELPF